MKNIHYVIHALLATAIIILFVIVLTEKPQSSISAAQSNIAVNNQTEIVYINLDTLLVKYDFSRDLNTQFTQKQTKYKEELKQKLAAFEKEASDFQEKLQRGAFLSQQRAENEQERLLLEQQKLQQLEYDVTNKLAAEQQELNMRLYDSISNFLIEYQQTHPYRLVLSYTYGGQVLYADKNMDITTEVLALLNKRCRKK